MMEIIHLFILPTLGADDGSHLPIYLAKISFGR